MKGHWDKLRAAILAVLVVAGIINYLDRSALSIANTTLQRNMHFSATKAGVLLSAFSVFYGLAQVPAGRLLDRIGARVIMAAGMVLWSGAQIATGMVSNFTSLVFTRIGLGVGESPFMIGGVKVIHDWYKPPERGLPTGLLNASTTLGQAFAPPLLTILLLSYGWRGMFILVGLLGFLPVLAWYPLYRERGNREPERPKQDHPVHSPRVNWSHFLRQRTLWGMMLGFSGINYTAWFYIAWLPGYLEIAHHLSITATGWLAALPFLMGSAGMLANGMVVDGLIRRGAGPMKTHKVLIAGGMICSAGCTLLVTRVEGSVAAAATMGTALFFIHFAGTSALGLVQTAAPTRLVATVGALQNFCSFLFASIAPVLTGWLLDRTHSFRIALVVCAYMTVLGAIAYITLVKRTLPDGMGGSEATP